jgi:GNAT superfamily N-acetyltransferase
VKLSFRALTKLDLSVGNEIESVAFGRPVGDSLRRHLTLQPNDWLLALADDVPVGLGGATHYDSFSYIGTLSVLPSIQGRGIGRAIMEALLQRVRERGRPTILLDASNEGKPLYTRLGFVEDDQAILLLRNDTIQAMPPVHNSTLSPLQKSDLPALVAFDTPLFGAARATVLASYLSDDPQRAFVTRDSNGSITGFLITQSSMLGPWTAINVEVAEQLLQHALALPFEKTPAVIIPALNRPAAQLLQRYGFRQDRALAHMRLGPPVPGRNRRTTYGQANFAIG